MKLNDIKLFPHQQNALEQTKDLNRVVVKGYEGFYVIDNKGDVYSLVSGRGRRKKVLIPYEKNGYLAVNLYKDGKVKHHYIHRLVAEAFIPNPDNLPEVNHLDCNKFNNSVENLEWCDRKQNLKHSYDKGLKRKGELHGRHKLTKNEVEQIRNLIGKMSQKEIALKFKISQPTVSAIKTGRLWKGR